ncbi:hypothetical protein ACFJIY_16685 [Pimelobacter simplex]|uniref:hypothetical protein n=1 Tax=Nocardioides simplex TaxID=2045 RepID=UPI00366DEE67
MLASSVWRGASQGWFIGGLVVGGTTTATLLAALGSLPRALLPDVVVAGAVAVVLGVVLLHELGALHLRLPQNARQVPERIAEAGPRFGALQFGLEMGTGMRTFLTSAAPYALLALVALVASPWEFVAAGAGFGGGRALMTTARNGYPEPTEWDRLLAKHDAVLRRCLVLLVVALAVVIVWIRLVR